LEAAKAADPDNPRLIATLGDLDIRSGNAAKALELVAQQKGSLADSNEIIDLKAAAQLALGQKKEARDSYAQIIKADPSAIGARRQLEMLLVEIGDFETARNLVKEGITLSPRNYQLHQDLAMIDLKATGVDAALATADRLASQDRDFPALRGLRGDIYLAANRTDDAVNAYAEALAAAPDGGIATRLAAAQLRNRKPEDAVKTLTDWLAGHPGDPTALEQLAEIQIALNHLPEAAGALEKLLAGKPHNAVALNNLAWVYQQQNDPRAQALARQAYVLSPGAQTADTLGWILTTGGDPQAGAALLRQANAEATTDPRLQYHYAVAMKATGNRAEAQKLLSAVVAVKGDFQEKADAQKLLDDMGKGS
jgi:Flp pilus assembly protein TadD